MCDKPEWFVQMTPTALVPVLHPPGSNTYINESASTMEYLDEKYPDTKKMHRETAEERAEDRSMIQLSKRVRNTICRFTETHFAFEDSEQINILFLDVWPSALFPTFSYGCRACRKDPRGF